MSKLTRRDFLKSSVAAGAIANAGALGVGCSSVKKTATDWVTLGNSEIQVTRLALGTGTFSGKIQRELGQPGFTRLVQHAYDRGIRFFECADSYGEMHEMLAEALKGIPRESYRLMTKFRWQEAIDPMGTIDRLRQELNSEYLDILLLHCLRTPGWSEQLKRLRDVFSEAKNRKIILAQGASCHGLLPLREYAGDEWLDVALVRVNHDGTKMDTVRRESNEKGDVNEVVSHINTIHSQGVGVIGMKLAGEGQFKEPEQRDAALKFVMGLGTVDAVTIGYKAPGEIDEAIERINVHLNA